MNFAAQTRERDETDVLMCTVLVVIRNEPSRSLEKLGEHFCRRAVSQVELSGKALLLSVNGVYH